LLAEQQRTGPVLEYRYECVKVSSDTKNSFSAEVPSPLDKAAKQDYGLNSFFPIATVITS